MREERAAAHSVIIVFPKDNSLREVRRDSSSTIVPEFSFTVTTARESMRKEEISIIIMNIQSLVNESGREGKVGIGWRSHLYSNTRREVREVR